MVWWSVCEWFCWRGKNWNTKANGNGPTRVVCMRHTRRYSIWNIKLYLLCNISWRTAKALDDGNGKGAVLSWFLSRCVSICGVACFLIFNESRFASKRSLKMWKSISGQKKAISALRFQISENWGNHANRTLLFGARFLLNRMTPIKSNHLRVCVGLTRAWYRCYCVENAILQLNWRPFEQTKLTESSEW